MPIPISSIGSVAISTNAINQLRNNQLKECSNCGNSFYYLNNGLCSLCDDTLSNRKEGKKNE